MNTPLSEQLAKKITLLIKEQDLRTGDRLPSERHLAQLLHTSRAPVREALRILSSQGLLYTRRGGGSYVQDSHQQWNAHCMEPMSSLLQADVFYRYDVLETRRALESSCAWHAAQRATAQDRDAIKRCFDHLVEQQQVQNVLLAAQADAKFHLAIAQASHNAVMLQVMRGLVDLVFSTVQESRRIIFQFEDVKAVERLTEQHHALMQAILTGDADSAKLHAQDHLDYVQDTIRKAEEDEARQHRIKRLQAQLG